MIQPWILNGLLILTMFTTPSLTAEENKPLLPKSALETLVEGNERYINGKLLHPNRCQESRDSVVDLQKPFATILGCADSRVSPEIVFDQGIGDLFVVRVAGNVVGPIELDSIEYSVLYLKSSLVLVMGHENCGAVTAVLNKNTKDIESISNLIEPAVEASKKLEGNPLENAVKTNVRMVVEQLKNSKELAGCVKNGSLEIVGGYYELRSGKVEILR